MEKYNSAAMMGFTVLRFSTEQVKAGVAIKQIEQLVGENECSFKTQQMDWSKYTIDGWLEQFGAWCETVRMKGVICQMGFISIKFTG